MITAAVTAYRIFFFIFLSFKVIFTLPGAEFLIFRNSLYLLSHARQCQAFSTAGYEHRVPPLVY